MRIENRTQQSYIYSYDNVSGKNVTERKSKIYKRYKIISFLHQIQWGAKIIAVSISEIYSTKHNQY